MNVDQAVRAFLIFLTTACAIVMFVLVLALLLAPQPDGNVNNPLRSARPDWDVVVIDQACARRLSTLDAEIVAARNELKAVRKEIEQVAEENALVMGAMIQMGSDPEPLQMRDGLTKTLQALVQGQPSLHLLDVNCETAPCIGVLWEENGRTTSAGIRSQLGAMGVRSKSLRLLRGELSENGQRYQLFVVGFLVSEQRSKDSERAIQYRMERVLSDAQDAVAESMRIVELVEEGRSP